MTVYTSNEEKEDKILIPIDETLQYYLRDIYKILSLEGVTEVCINKPCTIWYEIDNEWINIPSDFYTAANLDVLFNHIASVTKQQMTINYPIISASLETGERVQIIKPPSAIFHSLTIRKPATLDLTLEDLDSYGAFDHVEDIETDENFATVSEQENRLITHLKNKEFLQFFTLAVKAHKNIIVSGATGSGKTTFTKALIKKIDINERIITIEDVPELNVPQPNHVRLIYSKDARSTTKTTPKMLLESCLRMRPDRILLAELRGEEAFYYIRNVNSGHPGSITSIHASSTRQAFDQLMLYIKESTAGNNLSRDDIYDLLKLLVDIVVQYKKLENGKRVVSGIYFKPSRAK